MRRLLLLLLILLLPAASLADQTILLTFTGDVTLGCEELMRNQSESLYSFWKNEGDKYFFANFMEFFATDDQTVINLEGVLSDTRKNEVKTKTYRFRGDTAMAKILKLSSIDVANMANNHAYDYGRPGYTYTQNALKDQDIAYFGEKNIHIYEKGNIRIAFLGLNTTHYYDSRAWFRAEIPRLREEEGVDAVVFSFHVGQEYDAHRIARQEEYARAAINAGADLVIMHHPHVVQGMDVYKNRSIFYSLGNFCFGGNIRVQRTANSGKFYDSLGALVVRAELTFSDEGEYLGQQMKLYPVHTSSSAPMNDYQPRFVTGEEAAAVIKDVQIDTTFEVRPFDDELGYALQDYLPYVDVKTVEE